MPLATLNGEEVTGVYCDRCKLGYEIPADAGAQKRRPINFLIRADWRHGKISVLCEKCRSKRAARPTTEAR